MRSKMPYVLLLAVLTAGSVASSRATVLAQAPSVPGAQTEMPKGVIPLKVDVTLTRLQGDKKISSMPYTMLVMANDQFTSGRGSVRIGFDVPTGTQTSTTSQQGVTSSRADYRNIGIQIDVQVQPIDLARFRVQVDLTDSSIYSAEAESRGLPRTVDPVAFRSFSSRGAVLLRDGQSSPAILATDKITGETLRADVTLTVVK